MRVWGGLNMDANGRVGGLYMLSIRWRRFFGPRRGVVWVTATLSLVALLGVAALTIDLGRLAVATQRAQDVADAAALGAVYQLPDQTGARTRLSDVVTANNAANSWPDVSIAPNSDVIFYGPGSEVPHYGQLTDKQRAITVTAHVNDKYTFGRIAGLIDMHTQRSATAIRSESGGQWPAIFAMHEAETTEDDIAMHGGGAKINGDIHSNGSIKLTGNDYTINGQIRYRWTLSGDLDHFAPTGGIVHMKPETWPTWPEPYPVGLPWWSPSGVWGFGEVRQHFVDSTDLSVFVYNSDQDWKGGTLAPGIHIVDGDVTIKNGVVMENVTLVVKGKITTNGNGAIKKLTPYVDDMSLVSYASSSNQPAIKFNGADQVSAGTIFAPNGPITYNGGNRYQGSVIGYQVTFNGNGSTISPTMNTEANSTVQVSLVY